MHFPLMIDLKNKDILVFGGGKMACKRIKKLIKYEPNIKIISKEFDDKIFKLQEKYYKNITIVNKSYDKKLIDKSYFLIIAALDDNKKNEEISQIAKEKNILINNMSDFKNGDILFPAFIDEQDIKISICTNGASPNISKALKKEIKKLIDDDLKDKLKELRELRCFLKDKLDEEKRHKILKKASKMNLKEILDLKKELKNEIKDWNKR